MMPPMDEREQRALDFVRTELLNGEARLNDHVSKTFHWLMATLFAANGGAMVALLSDGAHELPGRHYALCWFAFGLVFSLLMGVLSSFVSFRAISRMASMRSKIEEGLIMGEAPSEALAEFISTFKVTWKTWTPSYAGATSFIFFIIGLGTIAGSLIRTA